MDNLQCLLGQQVDCGPSKVSTIYMDGPLWHMVFSQHGRVLSGAASARGPSLQVCFHMLLDMDDMQNHMH